MAPLRRTPWATHSELVTLHSLLFEDPATASGPSNDSVEKGVARLGIYLSSPSCPLFFPLLHSLLTASLLPFPPGSPATLLSTRLTYAMAIVRFINGMVDPLQSGAYARPIALLSRQLGIPEELVQMRHQATHEDLPSLTILRDGLWKCIAYLRDAAMTPLVYPSASTSADGLLAQQHEAQGTFAADLGGLLTQYKKLMKLYFRERTTKTTSTHNSTPIAIGTAWEGAQELRGVLRDIESVIHNSPLEDEIKRDLISRLLMAPGYLIAATGKKRSGRDHTTPGGVPEVPLSAVRIWTPLLRLISARLDDETAEDETDDIDPRDQVEEFEAGSMAVALARSCIDILRLDADEAYERDLSGIHGTTSAGDDGMDLDADYLGVPEATNQADEGMMGDMRRTKADEHAESIRIAAASWLVWLWGDSSGSLETRAIPKGTTRSNGIAGKVRSSEDVDQAWLTLGEKKGLGSLIMRGMGSEMSPGVKDYFGLSNVAEGLSQTDGTFNVLHSLTKRGLRDHAPHTDDVHLDGAMAEGDDLLDVMEERLRRTEATADGRVKATEQAGSQKVTDITSTDAKAVAPGWTLAAERWRECPIGVWRI